VNPADTYLLQAIQQVTTGGARLLVTLARRGKAIERDDPERAAYLLEAVMTHPLYKGGRLTFDMLEIEDVMLDGPPVELMSRREVTSVLSAHAHDLGDTLRRMGAPGLGDGLPVGASADDADVLDGSVHALTQNAVESVEDIALPRLSLGPEDELPRTTTASTAPDADRDALGDEPELQSSDYLYGYVVLGWLDVAGGIKALQS